jgi:hypothetical protein
MYSAAFLFKNSLTHLQYIAFPLTIIGEHHYCGKYDYFVTVTEAKNIISITIRYLYKGIKELYQLLQYRTFYKK